MPEGEPLNYENEFEISPEIEDEIMAKVQDINRPGIGFHWDINREADEILRDGLLGYGSKQMFLEKKKAPFYFNITGKIAENNILKKASPEINANDLELSYSSSLGSFLQSRDSNLIVLFDISNCEIINERGQEKKLNVISREAEGDEEGAPAGIDGYSLLSRLSPRSFTGLVMAPTREATLDEKVAHEKRTKAFTEYQMDVLKSDRLFSLSKMEKVIDPGLFTNTGELVRKQIEINKEKPENLLPIYDIKGNLLWPQNLSHEEVKAYLKEREEPYARAA